MSGPRYAIDRQLLPGLFQRAPGAREYVTEDGNTPLTFASVAEAEAFLIENTTEAERRDYKWTFEEL